jgi:hypothetical protein
MMIASFRLQLCLIGTILLVSQSIYARTQPLSGCEETRQKEKEWVRILDTASRTNREKSNMGKNCEIEKRATWFYETFALGWNEKYVQSWASVDMYVCELGDRYKMGGTDENLIGNNFSNCMLIKVEWPTSTFCDPTNTTFVTPDEAMVMRMGDVGQSCETWEAIVDLTYETNIYELDGDEVRKKNTTEKELLAYLHPKSDLPDYVGGTDLSRDVKGGRHRDRIL